MAEYVKVRLKYKTGLKNEFYIELPKDRRDNKPDTINDIISDWMDENKIIYKWFRIIGTPVLDKSKPKN
jgi:hypothetical protein